MHLPCISQVGGSLDLQPLGEGHWWTLLERDGMRVCAVPVQHSVPCVGFIIEEESKPGRLLVEKV